MNKFTFFVLPLFLSATLINAQNFSDKVNGPRPLSFKENKGQVSDQFFKPRADILFSGVAGDMDFYLKNNGISYQLNRVDKWEENKKDFRTIKKTVDRLPALTTIYRLDINWTGINPQAQIEKGESLSGYDNYYLASCPNGAVNVKSFTDITYKNIYPGIDLKWYGKKGNLKYDYYVSANADYKKIQLEYKGAEKIFVDASGELIIKTPLGTLKEQAPLVMQGNKKLNAKWIVNNNSVSFDIKNADPSLSLIIDPMVRVWGSYYGGSGDEWISYMSTNALADVFIAGGTTSSSNMATTGAHQTTLVGAGQFMDAYFAKFNSAGVRQWSTYYGGSDEDYMMKSVSDPAGNIFVTGSTESSDPGVIATPGAHQTVYSATLSPGDAFLVMFNSAGIRQWGTYYGGDGDDYTFGIARDNAGDIYISGGTVSPNRISTPGSHQSALAGVADAFVAKFSPSGLRQWGTYYGGTALDGFGDCVSNSVGDIYLGGNTSSTVGISSVGAHQQSYGGGSGWGGDAFFVKMNSAGVMQWATYYGGAGTDNACDLAVDASGNLYGSGICANSSGNIIATPGSHQPTYGGGNEDAFLVKFDPAGVRLWSTYYGGTGSDMSFAPAVDLAGNVYLFGTTSGSTGTVIATPCAYQDTYIGGSSDGFLVKFTSAGTRLWGTLYGSIFTDNCNYCMTDVAGNIIVSGSALAGSAAATTANAHQPLYGGGPSDGFFTKFDGCIPGNISSLTPAANLLVCNGNTTTLSTTCAKWYNTATGTVVLASGGTFTTGAIVSDTTFYLEDFGCGSISGTRTAIQLTLAPQPSITVTNSNPTACVSESVTLSASGASSYTWSGPSVSANTSTLQVYVLLNTTYSAVGVDANGCESTASITVVPSLCLGLAERSVLTNEVFAYPNPNKGEVSIRSNSEINLILSNELGQNIRSFGLSAANNFTITLDDLPNGVYFLSAEKGTKAINTKIVVIR